VLRRVDRILIRVPSVPAAVKYYRDVLGLLLLREEKQLAVLKFADAETELVVHSDPHLPTGEAFHLVDDVRDLYRRRTELKLQFASPPQPGAKGYRATVKDPFGTILHLIDRTAEAGTNAIEDARPPGALFAGLEEKFGVQRAPLIAAYQKIARTADDLPYTTQFEQLYREYSASFGDRRPDRAEVWRHLLNLRKAGKLPKLGEARSVPPAITPEQEQRLRELLGEDIGKRDRLPYSGRFDEVVRGFNAAEPRKLTPHAIWRLVARVAK
jgi:catechol 2,3-dioxygenase-like lactoylglutathione lyase family enzyme